MTDRLIRIALGVLVFISLIAVTEFALGFTRIPSFWEPVKKISPDGYIQTDDTGLLYPLPGTYSVIKIHKDTKEIIYDTTVSVDEDGIRITPLGSGDTRKRPVVFLGGSKTFGDGVQDDETLPFYVGSMTRTVKPYNYGFSGHGPFCNLAMMEKKTLRDKIKGENPVFIYSYIDGHIGRTIGSYRHYQWGRKHVYYKRNRSGKFVRSGNFETGRPMMTFFYELMRKSKIVRKFKLDFPPVILNRHIRYTADVIVALRDTIMENFEDGTFIVLIWPESKYADKLKGHLNAHRIPYLDYVALRTEGLYLHELDRHPRPEAYSIIAGELVQDLNLK